MYCFVDSLFELSETKFGFYMQSMLQANQACYIDWLMNKVANMISGALLFI